MRLLPAPCRVLPALWVAALAASCAGVSKVPPAEINEKYLSVIEGRFDRYRVKPGDTVVLRVYDTEGKLAEQTFLVTDDGRSDPFFMDGYRFGGKTVAEIETDARELFIASNEVQAVQGLPLELSVLVTPAAEFVYVHGELERLVLQVDLRPGMTIQDAIARSGGIRITADDDGVLLRRPFSHPPGSPERYRVDISLLGEEVILLPNDHIHVERTVLATIVAYLREYVFGIFPTSEIFRYGIAGATF